MTTAALASAADPLGSSSSVHNPGRSPASASTLSSAASSSARSPRGGAGEPIPSGSLRSLRSRRTELDTDLHSTSSHSRRSTRSGMRSVLSLHKTHSKSNLYHHPLKATVPGGLPLTGPHGGGHPPAAYATRGIVNYEDTDNESSSCDDDDDNLDGSSSNDSCSTFAESTNDCVANNRYLCRGMSIEIGAIGLGGDNADLSVSEFDDFAALDGDDPRAPLTLDDIEADAYDEMLLLTSTGEGNGGTGGGGGGGITTSSVVSGSSYSSGGGKGAAPILDPLVEEDPSALLPATADSTPPVTPPDSPLLNSSSVSIPPLTPPELLVDAESAPAAVVHHVDTDGPPAPSRGDDDDDKVTAAVGEAADDPVGVPEDTKKDVVEAIAELSP